jgi:hypothetical protein
VSRQPGIERSAQPHILLPDIGQAQQAPFALERRQPAPRSGELAVRIGVEIVLGQR